MTLQKSLRIENRELLDSMKWKPCIICGIKPCDPSHIKTRGSGGDDIEWNVVPMCRQHHTEWGTGGYSKFVKKYPYFYPKLRSLGWISKDGKLRRF